jgi:cyclic-di-AMP phosphodiesterase PgpH
MVRGQQPSFWRQAHSSLLLVSALSVLTLTIGHRFYSQPQLVVGKLAPETIRVPYADQVEDRTATESARSAIRNSVKVYTLDIQTNQAIQQQLSRLLDEAQQLRLLAGTLPIVPPADLDLDTQQYLRQVGSSEWQLIISAVTNATLNEATLRQQREPAQTAIAALWRYRQRHSRALFRRLITEVEDARRQYQQVTGQPVQGNLQQTKIPVALLDLAEPDWQRTRTMLPQIMDRMLAQGIVLGLDPNVLSNAVQLHVSASVPESATDASKQIILASLRPNITTDWLATQQQAEKAASQVQPVWLSVQKGDVIVRKGFPINDQAFAKLDHFGLSRRQLGVSGLFGLAALVSGAIAAIVLMLRSRGRTLRQRDYWLLLILTASVPLSASFGLTATPMPLVGLLMSSFHGAVLGSSALAFLTMGMALSGTMPLKFLASSAAGALVASLVAYRLRSREELALLGGAVGLVQGSVYLVLHLITVGGSSWVSVIGTAALHGVTGFIWCVLALGISPYLEHLFDLITPIRLAELSNPNRPLLQRLATEAPGTFQHTLFVSTLAEAAARKLGCNVELVRAGCLYHDIGKMHDPLAFIENQINCENKHDQINDPWLSADLIKKHVTEGIVMARKYRLPKAIEVFIPEHQGTMLIAYFFHQAQLRSQEDPNLVILESDFRYDGPAPKSRETGIVMLADSCEAALRSLKDTESSVALVTVHKIFKARWRDHQMQESGLKESEMPKMAEIFVRVWQEYHHQRIAYPKAIAKPRSAKNVALKSDDG